jgi:uncharacterized protein (TIGR00255 family)
MTGFGAASEQAPMGLVQIEIRSVNSRFFEYSSRMAEELRSFEAQLREHCAQALRRGKVECRLQLSRGHATNSELKINRALATQLMTTGDQLRGLSSQPPGPWTIAELLRWPGVLIENESDPEATLALIDRLCKKAIASLIESRQREGEKLKAQILDRLDQLQSLATRAGGLVPESIRQLTERMRARLTEAFEGVGAKEREDMLTERIRQEAHAASIRSDVAEEIDRLQVHVQEMARCLRSPEGDTLGKRLDFLTQEMHREANTIGSKSAGLELTQLTMEMKLLIEQIREQVQNIQ